MAADYLTMELSVVLNTVVELPPAPQILPKLQKLLRDMNSGLTDIVSLLKLDAGLTAQIVRMSNSAFYGGVPVQGLDEAVNRLGFREVFRIVGLAATKQALGGALETYKMPKGELLEQSVAVAVAMTTIRTSRVKAEDDSRYTIGLLHALGKVVINQFFVKKGMEIYDLDADEDIDVKTERSILGFDHAEAGAAIMEKWKFSSEIHVTVACQYEPDKAGEHKETACLLALSRWCVKPIREKTNVMRLSFDEPSGYIETLGLTEDSMREFIQTAQEDYEKIREMFSN